jgi:FimV-like protein
MRTQKRGNKIMFITNKRIIQIFFLIPVLLIGLLVAPASYAENTKATYGPIKSSDTLGRIVSRNYSGSNLSQQQIMTGILRANPEAFIGGNIHFLLRGATLRLPAESLIATIDPQQAKKLIKEHYQYFKRGKTGNFKIEPLDNAANTDTADFERDATIILSEGSGSNAQQQQQQDGSQAETIKNKPVINSSTQIKKAAPSPIINNINDIELESLKIKISQLEKILSRRGIPDSNSTNDEISKELKDTLKTQKAKIDLLEQERNSKNKELDQLQTKITELEASLEKMSQSPSDNTITVGTADVKDKLIAELKQQNTVLEKNLSSLQTKLDQKTAEVASLTAEISQSKQKIGELETKLLDSDKESAKLDQQIAEMEAKLAKIRQEPARNLAENEVNSTTSSFGMPPWVWLLPALFLLSILAYLFKRSFSQPKKALVVDDVDATDYNLQKTEILVDEIEEEQPYQQKESNRAEVIASVPDIISSASEEESVEASIKLDIGKAYLDMDMSDAAIEILQEAYEEGSEKQRLEVQALLEKLT